MACQVVYRLKAIEDLSRLSQALKKRVEDKLKWLAENFDQVSPESLKGDFANLFKLRVGGYRVIYDVDRQRQTIIVVLIAHRREVYKHNL